MKKYYYEQSNYFYNKKDKATLKVLKMIDYKNVNAYFIKIRSHYLKGKLFEIVLNDYDMILHSTSLLILENLRNECVFYEESRQSLIDNYVNTRY